MGIDHRKTPESATDLRNVSIPELRDEIAHCRACGARLRFGTGEYGQSFQACTNRECYFRRPHAIVPDLSLMKGPDKQDRLTERRRRERAESAEAPKPRGNPNFRRSDS